MALTLVVGKSGVSIVNPVDRTTEKLKFDRVIVLLTTCQQTKVTDKKVIAKNSGIEIIRNKSDRKVRSSAN